MEKLCLNHVYHLFYNFALIRIVFFFSSSSPFFLKNWWSFRIGTGVCYLIDMILFPFQHYWFQRPVGNLLSQTHIVSSLWLLGSVCFFSKNEHHSLCCFFFSCSFRLVFGGSSFNFLIWFISEWRLSECRMTAIDTHTHTYTHWPLFVDVVTIHTCIRICAFGPIHLSFLVFYYFFSHLVSYPHINCFCCHWCWCFTSQTYTHMVYTKQRRSHKYSSFVLAMPIVPINKEKKKN